VGRWASKGKARLFLDLPEHDVVTIKFVFYAIDSWDKEEFYVKVDDQLVYTRKVEYNDGFG
jgi:hypothetical protein